jgi:hypothetical protein
MRTTLTLDQDVERLLAAAAHRERRTFKEIVNDAIRRGLTTSVTPKLRPKLAPPHKTTLLAGIETSRLNALADELATETFIKAHRRR